MDHIYNRFCDFFAESVYFTSLANEKENSNETDLSSTFAKVAILSSVFALEAAANSILQSLNLSKTQFRKNDQLPILEKYKFFLFKAKPNLAFDDQSPAVTRIKELINFRHNQVHSKIDFQAFEEDADGHVVYPEIELSKQLKLPFRSMFIEPKHAISALQALDNFLDVYFIDWCQMSVQEVSLLLMHQSVHDGVGFPMSTPIYDRIDGFVDEFGLKLNFLNRRIFKVTFSRKKKTD